jgi:CheY-like chemotaxis protein
MTPAYCEVDTAQDGETGLQFLAEKQYDAILLDIEMPRPLTGIRVLREIRSRYPDLKAPVIAFTAHVLPRDEQDLYDEGFDGYLGKPFVRADLLDVLRQHIDGLE